MRPVTHASRRRFLIPHLVQLPLLGGNFIQTGRDHQHRHAITVSLPHGRHDVAQTGPCNHIGHAGLAGGARIAIGHETGTLFMARQDMGDAGLFDTAIKLDVMHAGNAEYHIDPARLQSVRNLYAKRALLGWGLAHDYLRQKFRVNNT